MKLSYLEPHKKGDALKQKKWKIVSILNLTDVLDKLGRTNYFITLDIARGFHQVEIAPEDVPKRAFNVENDTFHRIMNNFLRGLDNTLKQILKLS